MAPYSKREKILAGTSIVLLLLVLFLSFKIVDYKIDLFVIGGDKYSGPPSMIESIERASMIFLCKTEVEDRTARYRISDILYKDRDYDFLNRERN